MKERLQKKYILEKKTKDEEKLNKKKETKRKGRKIWTKNRKEKLMKGKKDIKQIKKVPVF